MKSVGEELASATFVWIKGVSLSRNTGAEMTVARPMEMSSVSFKISKRTKDACGAWNCRSPDFVPKSEKMYAINPHVLQVAKDG